MSLTKKQEVKVIEAFELEPHWNEMFVTADGQCYGEKEDALIHAGFCENNTVHNVVKGKEAEAELVYGEVGTEEETIGDNEKIIDVDSEGKESSTGKSAQTGKAKKK